MSFVAKGRAIGKVAGVAAGWRVFAGLATRRLKLREKLLILYAISGAVILLTTASFYARSLADSVSRQYNEHGLTIWRLLDASYSSPADLWGPMLQERIRRLTMMSADIREIRVYAPLDNFYMVVASSDPARVGHPAAPDDLQPLFQDRPIWRESSAYGGVAQMSAPLHAATDGRLIGVLAVDFHAARKEALVWQQVATFFAIGSLGGILLLAALYWESERVLLRPLLVLQRQIAAIAGGHLGSRAGLRRSDEIGQLADSFDLMAEALEQREQENTRLQEELRLRYQEAEQRAVRDSVTGLYDHRHFHERLTQELARARRFGQPLALLFCDLDRFKAVNDSHGHQAGDRVLQAVARTLGHAIREIDIAARYGGEEFTVILPNTGVEGALRVAERIRFRVGVQPVALSPKSAVPVTLSIGIASYPDDAVAETELVHYADLAMYYAKRLGRNQVRTYQDVKHLTVTADAAGAWEKDAAYFEAVQSLAAAVDARDRYTHRHSSAVARYATALARAMGLGGAALTEIAVGALLHDVGKIGVPDQILGKPGPLTEEEWATMREHPVVGKAILQHIKVYEPVIPLILHHHERWDGMGYPAGLVGEHIPLGARIIAVADAYHAMTSDRPYRRGFSRQETLDMLHNGAGTQWDPKIVQVFLEIPEEALFDFVELVAAAETGGGDDGNPAAPLP